MFKLASRLGFGLESPDEDRILCLVSWKDFQRDQFFQIGVGGEIHRPHTTLTELALDLIFSKRLQW